MVVLVLMFICKDEFWVLNHAICKRKRANCKDVWIFLPIFAHQNYLIITFGLIITYK